MNGTAGISFQETGLEFEVRAMKSTVNTSPGKLKKRLSYNFKQLSKQIMQAKASGVIQIIFTAKTKHGKILA